MKKYEKPMAEKNEYTLIERLANLDSWLESGDGAGLGIESDIASYTTSYNMAS